jgi:hypothetical protein
LAIRVRKLARELERSSAEVLGFLHALGFERYRSTEDQVPDLLVARVKGAIRQGVKPLPVELPPEELTSVPPSVPPEPEADLMSQLVPGVVRRGEVPRPAPRPVQREERRGVEVDRAEIGRQRDDLVFAQGVLEEARAAVERERAAVRAEREHLDAERAAFEAERAAARPTAAAVGIPLSGLLEARGLRGVEEQEKALGALASAHLLRAALGVLTVTDPPQLERLLADRVVLAAEAGPIRGAATVVVPSERAELPEKELGDRELSAIGEHLMLLGLRRVAVVGGPARWHKLLRDGLDQRIELRFLPGGSRGRAEAEADVTRTDLVILWATPVSPEAREIYETSRAILVEVPGPEIPTLLRAVRARLDKV